MSRQQQKLCQSLPPACLPSWLKFGFAGMPAIKTCDVSCRWRHNPHMLGSSIEGSTSGYVAGTLVAYENQALERVDCTDFFKWPPL